MSKSTAKQQKKAKKADSKEVERLAKSVRSITKIIPIKDTYRGVFKYYDGSFMDIIQIRSVLSK